MLPKLESRIVLPEGVKLTARQYLRDYALYGSEVIFFFSLFFKNCASREPRRTARAVFPASCAGDRTGWRRGAGIF